MVKISPIAIFLSKNNVITKRDNNICRFYTKEGLYLGRQIKTTQYGANVYIRHIFGEGFKTLFYECKAIAETCAYIKNDKFPLGLGIIPTNVYIFTHSIDYTTNSVVSEQKTKVLKNRMELIAIEENTNVGIFNVSTPLKYDEKLIEHKEFNLKYKEKIKHNIH